MAKRTTVAHFKVAPHLQFHARHLVKPYLTWKPDPQDPCDSGKLQRPGPTILKHWHPAYLKQDETPSSSAGHGADKGGRSEPNDRDSEKEEQPSIFRRLLRAVSLKSASLKPERSGSGDNLDRVGALSCFVCGQSFSLSARDRKNRNKNHD